MKKKTVSNKGQWRNDDSINKACQLPRDDVEEQKRGILWIQLFQSTPKQLMIAISKLIRNIRVCESMCVCLCLCVCKPVSYPKKKGKVVGMSTQAPQYLIECKARYIICVKNLFRKILYIIICFLLNFFQHFKALINVHMIYLRQV